MASNLFFNDSLALFIDVGEKPGLTSSNLHYIIKKFKIFQKNNASL